MSAPYPPVQPTPGPGAAPNNTLGLVSLILGIVSIPLACCFGAGALFGVAAIVLGIMGKGKAERGEANNRGQAQAGFICGIAGVAIAVLWFVLAVVANVALPGVSN